MRCYRIGSGEDFVEAQVLYGMVDGYLPMNEQTPIPISPRKRALTCYSH
jgi:hypothetical protein